MRWWDGRQWTAATAAPPGAANTKTMVVLAHLSGIVGGWILALVIYLIDGGKDRFVRHHASEALNFELTLLIALLVDYTVTFGAFAVGIAFAPFLGLFALGLVVAIALSVAGIACSIIGIVHGSRGEWWVYPVNLRMVKGRCPVEEQYPVFL
jgi:uncharacterized Tic20 family protein